MKMAMDLILWSGIKLQRPKTGGTLGTGNAEKKNRAFLANWLWRFPLEGTSLSHSVIAANMEFIQMDRMQTWLEMGPIEAPRKLYLKSTPLFLVLLPKKWVMGRLFVFGRIIGGMMVCCVRIPPLVQVMPF